MAPPARALPFPDAVAWAIVAVLAVTGPAIQWFAAPDTGIHPYTWAAVVLAPPLAIAALWGREHPTWSERLVVVATSSAVIVTAIVSPDPVPGGLLRPVAAMPLLIAAALVPSPRTVIALSAVSLVATYLAARSAPPDAMVAALVAQLAAAGIAVGLAYGWRQGRVSAMTVGRLSAQVEQEHAQQLGLRRFLHRAAHELRTPLTPLMLLPDTLARETDPDRRARHAQRMKDKVRDVTAVLERMATLASMGEATDTPRADISAIVRRRADHHAIERDVPSVAFAHVHEEALELALDELVGNAKAAPANRIRVQVIDDGDFWAVHVDDDGPGIPEADRAVLLEPFGRVDIDMPPQAGTGLGLAITAAVALGAGGGLRLDESPLGGLRATLSIPKAPG